MKCRKSKLVSDYKLITNETAKELLDTGQPILALELYMELGAIGGLLDSLLANHIYNKYIVQLVDGKYVYLYKDHESINSTPESMFSLSYMKFGSLGAYNEVPESTPPLS